MKFESISFRKINEDDVGYLHYLANTDHYKEVFQDCGTKLDDWMSHVRKCDHCDKEDHFIIEDADFGIPIGRIAFEQLSQNQKTLKFVVIDPIHLDDGYYEKILKGIRNYKLQ